MFDDLIRDGKNTIRGITAALGTILSVFAALSFLEGFVANSQNIYTTLGFLVCWAVFSALTDELDSVLKKALASVGIPTVIIGLAMVIIHIV